MSSKRGWTVCNVSGSAPNNLNNNLRITFYMKRSNTLIKGELKTQIKTSKLNRNNSIGFNITMKSFNEVVKKIIRGVKKKPPSIIVLVSYLKSKIVSVPFNAIVSIIPLKQICTLIFNFYECMFCIVTIVLWKPNHLELFVTFIFNEEITFFKQNNHFYISKSIQTDPLLGERVGSKVDMTK